MTGLEKEFKKRITGIYAKATDKISIGGIARLFGIPYYRAWIKVKHNTFSIMESFAIQSLLFPNADLQFFKYLFTEQNKEN